MMVLLYTYNYIIKNIGVFRQLNNAYLLLLKDGLYKDGENYYFSFVGYKIENQKILKENGVQDKKSLQPVSLNDAGLLLEIKRIRELIKTMAESGQVDIDINLENRETMEDFYLVHYKSCLFYYAFLLQFNKFDLNKTDQPKVTVQIINRIGSEIKLKLIWDKN